ncbi:MAG: hypothetical protein WBQ65_21040 [Bryobacteraceae bacterium]
MTNYTRFDVAAFKWGAASRAARMLSLADDFLGTSELLEQIQARDAEAAALLTQFFAVYDDWYELSSQMIEDDAIRMSHQEELLDKIHARDDARQRLIAHLAKR